MRSLSALHRRVERLEATGGSGLLVVHLRSFIGEIDEPLQINQLHQVEPQQWSRQVGESAREFRDRAAAEATRSTGRVVVLNETNRGAELAQSGG